MGTENLREERAFQAVVVSALRKFQEVVSDFEEDSELTEKDRAALELLGPDFVGRLLRGDLRCRSIHAEREESQSASEGTTVGEAALYRSEGIDDDTAKELEERDKEIIERKKKQHDDEASRE